MIDFAIREMKSNDVEAVAALEQLYQPRPWTAEMFDEELGHDNRIYLVAETERIVGFAGLMVIGEEGHVNNILVDESYQRRGIGKALLEELIARGVGIGVRHVTLEVRSQNEPALGLYADLGLAPVGARKAYYGDDDALIMWAHDVHLRQDAAKYSSAGGNEA